MDDNVEETRRSLLDVVLEKVHKAGKQVVVSRLVYVAAVEGKQLTSKTEIEAMHEAVWRRVIDEGEADYTGLLLCFSQCFVGVVEAQTSTLLTFLRELCALPKGERLFSKVRIISSTEDVPSRAYTQWMTAFFKGDDVGKPTPLEDEVLVDRASDVNLGLIKLGKTLADMSQKELETALGSLETAFLELPAVSTVLGLVTHSSVPDLEEYLDIFDTPVDIDLDSEQIWPAPLPITFG